MSLIKKITLVQIFFFSPPDWNFRVISAEIKTLPTWYEGEWRRKKKVSEAVCELCTGGVETWQTENLQLQWHSLAAQVIADISNVWSAKHKCQRTCKSTDYLQEKPKCFCQVSFAPNPQQSKYINSTAQRACWCSFTFLIKLNPDIITIMPFFVAIVHNCVVQVHRVQKSTKVWHAKCLKTRLYLVNKNWNFISVPLKSVFPFFFLFLVFFKVFVVNNILVSSYIYM